MAAQGSSTSPSHSPPPEPLADRCPPTAGAGYVPVTSNVVVSSAVESPPTQTSKVEASMTQSRAAAFQ